MGPQEGRGPEVTASQEPSTSRFSPPAVKICGLRRREDAEAAARAGADYLGVVLVPGTARAMTPETAREVLRGLLVPVVVVVADSPLSLAVEAAEILGAEVIQLHGAESPGFVAELAAGGPWRVWKSIRVRGVDDVGRGLETYGEVADGLLLDGWHPVRIGGSGVSFSWAEVEAVRDAFPEGLDLIAAGGLTPSNVEEAVRRLAPEVVDVSSGVELSPGIKSPELIAAFVRNANRPGLAGESRRIGDGPGGTSGESGVNGEKIK